MNKSKKHYTLLSKKHTCRRCGKGIKINLINRKVIVPSLCYIHWMEKQMGSSWR